MTSPEPTGATIDGAPAREDVAVAGPDPRAPGQPLGPEANVAPNIVSTSRRSRAERRAQLQGRNVEDILREQDDERRRQGLPVQGDSTPGQSSQRDAQDAPQHVAASSAGAFGATEQERPNDSANKETWVEYAVSQGANRDEAKGQNKADLICQYGGGDD